MSRNAVGRLTVADLSKRAGRLVAELAPGAADRERHRELPYAQIRRIADERLFTFRVPRAYGGPGSTVAELFQFVVDLSAADSNIAQALRPGFLTVESLIAGIARNALTNAVAFARERARPIVHAAAKRSTDDLYVQHAVGEISARAFAAEAAVLRAAGSIDRALAVGGGEAQLTVAAVDVAQAQFFAAEAALRCGELIFDVGGASATLREHNLDRHWRNARTVANHNPRAYKAGVVGSYLLNGTEPPAGGLF